MHAGTETVLDRYGHIDVLVKNAGFGRLSWLEKLHPSEDVQEQVQVNLLGLIWTAQAVLPPMIARRRGHIINIGSMAGHIATLTYSVYAATKFGVRGFTDALRREVGVYGIRVSGIYPGGVESEFRQHAHIRRKTDVSTPRRLRLTCEQVAEAGADAVKLLAPFEPTQHDSAEHQMAFVQEIYEECRRHDILMVLEPVAIEWLWKGRLPRGKLVILSGDPGLGKTTVLIDIAARVGAAGFYDAAASWIARQAGRPLISAAAAIIALIKRSVILLSSLGTSVISAPYARIVYRFSSLKASEKTTSSP